MLRPSTMLVACVANAIIRSEGPKWPQAASTQINLSMLRAFASNAIRGSNTTERRLKSQLVKNKR